MKMLVGPNVEFQPKMQLVKDDLVQSISNPQNVGIVSRLSNDSLCHSNLEVTHKDVDGECIPTSFARVLWLKSQELDEDVINLKLIDRSFTIGDIVAPFENPKGQKGIVMDVCMYVDLELANGKIIEGIDSCKLQHVHSYMPGDYVIHDDWLGRVEEVMDNVTVMFDGGAKCKIFCANVDHLIPIENYFTNEKNFPYHLGQKVRGATPRVFKLAKWLKGSWRETLLEGMISKIEVGSILVSWITSSATLSGFQPSTMPAILQKPSTLHPLMYISHINCQLGDWLFLPLGFDTEEYNLISRNEINILNQKLLHSIPSGYRSPIDFNNDKILESSLFLTLDTNTDISTLNAHKPKLNRQQKRAKLRECKTIMKKTREIEQVALVVKTKTKVDIMWQDGSKSCGIEASSLTLVEYLDGHEFWPGQFVMDQGLDGEDKDHSEHRIGMIKNVDATQRTTIVQWLEQAKEVNISNISSKEEKMSVYEIIENPHFNYCIGDVVIRLAMEKSMTKLNDCSKELLNQSSKDVDTSNKDVRDDEKLHVVSNKDIEEPQKERLLMLRPSYNIEEPQKKSRCHRFPTIDLSLFGNVIDLKDGKISVIWANGNISKVGPGDIVVINNEEDIQIEESEYQILFDSNNLTWTSMEYSTTEKLGKRVPKLIFKQSPMITQTTPFEIDNSSANEKCTKMLIQESLAQKMKEVQDASLEICSPRQYRHSIAIVCKKLFSQFSSILHNLKLQSTNLICTKGTLLCSNIDDIIDTYHNISISDHSSLIYTNIDQNLGTTISSSNIDNKKYMCSKCSSEYKDPIEEVTSLHSLANSISRQEDSCNLEPFKNQNTKGIEKKSKWIKQFDFVCGEEDHHFVDLEYQNPQRKWIKTIQDEWKILEKNLPNSIYVRTYEDRMDLLRAAIIGAQGTPYHDSLFIFDIYLPKEFPLAPPVLFYHSGGLRLNPNLYENGSVCLSLLNTWIGGEIEVWNATNSSILQLLISIQELVLNASPYFNEAGYKKQIGLLEGNKNSFFYNENAFLLSCKSTLLLLHRPLQHFEYIIWYHFKERGPMLLKACKAYLQGAPVGSMGENLQTIDDILDMPQNSTMGFRITLEKLFIKLTIAFRELENQFNYQSLECHSS